MNKNLINYLVEHELDINKENQNGKTSLLNACRSGNEDLVQYLVDHRADINKENKDDEIPLFLFINI